MRFWKRRPDPAAPLATEDLLSDWLPGREAIITEVGGSSWLAGRLLELGLMPGERIRVLRRGSALVVQVGEGRFCLRRHDAQVIRVCDALDAS